FISCLRTGERCESEGKDYLKTVAAVFARYDSAETGMEEQLNDDHATHVHSFMRRRHCRAHDNPREPSSETPAYRILHAGLPELGMENDSRPGRAARLRRNRIARFDGRDGSAQKPAVHRR